MYSYYDIDFFFHSGRLDKATILKEVYFEIKNFLMTFPFEMYLNPNYGIYLYQYENENMTDEKLVFLQVSLMTALIQLNERLPEYKRFVVSPATIFVGLEDNKIIIRILTVLESDFKRSLQNNSTLLADDFLRVFEEIPIGG